MTERTVGPHEFWHQICGLDTHRRGPNYARLDTPWNAFTADGSKLVCTLWVDLIVDVHVGALVASFLGQALGWYAPGQGAGLIGAVIGAIVLLVVCTAIAKRRV